MAASRKAATHVNGKKQVTKKGVGRRKGARPVRKERVSQKLQCIEGRLLFGVSKQEPHEVLIHRERERRADGKQILLAMGG